MFNLLIVDDEEMIRDKLMNNIDWMENDFEKVFEACDGLKALEIIKTNKIDIVVTDIQMPEMSGIELIREIKEIDKNIRTIVISGYADFEYAKESIALNVDDYILKPFISKKLLDIVNKVKDEIIRERSEKVEAENLKRQLRENKKALRDKLFNDLLNNNFIGSIQSNLEYLEMTEIDHQPYVVAVIDIDNFAEVTGTEEQEKRYIYNLMLFNWVHKFFETSTFNHYVINYKIDQIVLVCYSNLERISQVLEDVIKRVSKDIGLEVTIGIGNIYSDLEDMYIAYKEAFSAAMLRCIHGKGIVYSFNDMNFENKTYSRQLFSLINHKLYDNLKIGVFEEIKEDIVSIIAELKSTRLGMDSINTVISNIILLSYKTINEMGYNAADIFDNDFNPYLNIRSIEGIAQLEEWFFDFFYKINEYINKQRNNRNEMLIKKVKEYVDNNYKLNISLTSISKDFAISTGYLSILFNDYVGQNFIDYLTNLRLQRAKELLKNSDLKIYEVAQQAGYRDAYYFSSVFKKAVGVNPTDYRERFNAF